jgi:hypothetical protein
VGHCDFGAPLLKLFHRGFGDVGEGGNRVDEAERRRREFIWAHHPDRGGDAGVFIAGLSCFDEESGSPGPEPLPRVVVVARRAWPVRLVIALVRWLRRDRSAPRVR